MMNLILLLLFALLLIFPQASLEGARNGLLLWFHTVLPTLFPFLFLSSLLVKTGLAHRLSRAMKPIVTPLFRVSEGCGYAILIGLVSGYPLGAKTCADLVRDGSISKKEGQYLLCFCNNASPMFLISFIGGSLLGFTGFSCYVIWLIVLVSALITAFLYRMFSPKVHSALRGEHYPLHAAQTGRRPQPAPAAATLPRASVQNQGGMAASGGAKTKPFGPALEESLEAAIHTITLVGGYIILFGLLGSLACGLSFLPPLWSAFLSGILEITTGANALTAAPAAALPFLSGIRLKTALLCALLAFGGLSGVLQTKSVLGDSGLSIMTYMKAKIIHAALAALLFLLAASFLPGF